MLLLFLLFYLKSIKRIKESPQGDISPAIYYKENSTNRIN